MEKKKQCLLPLRSRWSGRVFLKAEAAIRNRRGEGSVEVEGRKRNLYHRLAERKESSLRMVKSAMISAYGAERRSLQREQQDLLSLQAPFQRWRELCEQLERAEGSLIEEIIRKEMDDVRRLFGVTVTDPQPRLEEIQARLADSTASSQELQESLQSPTASSGAVSAPEDPRWPTDARWEHARAGGTKAKLAMRQLRGRLRAIQHRASLSGESQGPEERRTCLAGRGRKARS